MSDQAYTDIFCSVCRSDIHVMRSQRNALIMLFGVLAKHGCARVCTYRVYRQVHVRHRMRVAFAVTRDVQRAQAPSGPVKRHEVALLCMMGVLQQTALLAKMHAFVTNAVVTLSPRYCRLTGVCCGSSTASILHPLTTSYSVMHPWVAWLTVGACCQTHIQRVANRGPRTTATLAWVG